MSASFPTCLSLEIHSGMYRASCCLRSASSTRPGTDATVIDLHSRRLLGYAMDAHHDTQLVVGALNMAAATRGGDVAIAFLDHPHTGPVIFSAAPQRGRWPLGPA